MPVESESCPNCGTHLESEQERCPRCGRPRSSQRRAVRNSQTPPDETEPQSQSAPPPTNATPVSTKQRRAKLGDYLFWTTVVVLGSIALLLGGIIVYNHWQQTQSPPVEILIGPELRANEGIPAANIPPEMTLQPPTSPVSSPLAPSPSPSPVFTKETAPTATSNSVSTIPLDGGQTSSEVEFRDDFSSPSLGWSEIVRENSSRGYLPDAYYIEVSAPGVFALSFAPENFIPDEVSFDAQIVLGTAGGTFGLLCRYIDEQSFYLVELDPFRGEIALGERVAGVYQALTNPEWQPAPGLDPTPEAVNRVQIRCLKEQIEVSLNGNLIAVAVITQPLQSANQTALFAAGYSGLDPQGFRVVFDNYYAFRHPE